MNPNGEADVVEERISRLEEELQQLYSSRAKSGRKMKFSPSKKERAGRSGPSLYRTAFELSDDAIIFLDHSFRITRANPSACRFFGRNEEELLGKYIKTFIPVIAYDLFRTHAENYMAEKEVKGDMPILLPDNTERVGLFTLAEDSWTGLPVLVMKDITKQNELNFLLEIYSKSFTDLFENSLDGFVIYDKERTIINANSAACRKFEISKEEFVGKSFNEFIDSEAIPSAQALRKQVDEEGAIRVEFPFKLLNGKRKYFDCSTKADVFGGLYITAFRDTTERRRIERELAEKETKFRAIFENALDGILLWDENLNILEANTAASDILEVPAEMLPDYNLFDFVKEKNKEAAANYVRELMRKGFLRLEASFRLLNGKKKQIELTMRREITEGAGLVIIRDVTARHKMIQDLSRNERKLKGLFNKALDGFALIDQDGYHAELNPAAKHIVGIPDTGIKRYHFTDFFTAGQLKTVLRYWREACKDGAVEGEVELTKLNGQKRAIEFSASKDIYPGLHLIAFRDLTEKKEMEEKIRKSETLNVLGELAAGIGHEIRNPLTSIKGFIRLLENDSINEAEKSYFQIVNSELQRIESITTEFLYLARPQAHIFKYQDVSVMMAQTLEIMKAEANLNNIQIHARFSEELPDIPCIENQLKQVFLNLVKNGIEAMENGGNLFVEVKNEADKELVISIKDEGKGIPDEKLKRVGEPFYTTKEKGTGLGLMVSYKIVKEHGGRIEVESEPGQGTTFCVRLPIQDQRGDL
ncbi:PAS domain-containing sensor histidine kinase [Bacillus marinisedimentorum]|uniref:PAS domain-containing sensor histidine kinase n=1 Tax=Bacillus marinisedimentorum TaxID=1821260 RepID=UPI00087265B5|nr:PAS domain-containing sensor histidine kinase [Bacillus marinisedimentorum]